RIHSYSREDEMSKRDINHHVGKRLRLRRTMLGLSQESVGRAVGVASQQVQKYEKGTNMMSVNRLHQFANVLHVPVSYFFEQYKHAPRRKKGSKKTSRRNRASDRESLEIIKSFKRIKNRALRKRLADLTRLLSIKMGR